MDFIKHLGRFVWRHVIKEIGMFLALPFMLLALPICSIAAWAIEAWEDTK